MHLLSLLKLIVLCYSIILFIFWKNTLYERLTGSPCNFTRGPIVNFNHVCTGCPSETDLHMKANVYIGGSSVSLGGDSPLVRDEKAQILAKFTKVYKAQSYKTQIWQKYYKAQNKKRLQSPKLANRCIRAFSRHFRLVYTDGALC